MYLNLPSAPGLDRANAEITRKSGEGNSTFKTDCDRREKVDHRRALFKMAVPSTSATPSPTTTAARVTQTVAAQRLVASLSLKAGLEISLVTERVS